MYPREDNFALMLLSQIRLYCFQCLLLSATKKGVSSLFQRNSTYDFTGLGQSDSALIRIFRCMPQRTEHDQHKYTNNVLRHLNLADQIQGYIINRISVRINGQQALDYQQLFIQDLHRIFIQTMEKSLIYSLIRIYLKISMDILCIYRLQLSFEVWLSGILMLIYSGGWFVIFIIRAISLIDYNNIAINNKMEPQKTFDSYFEDYPSILKGLNKLKIYTPTDFQQQLLEIENDIHNLIITAPLESGKTLALLLHSIRKFVNEEEGLMVLLSHSKELSQQLHHMLGVMVKVPIVNLYMQQLGQVQNKQIIIGSPVKVNNLWKKEKDRIIAIVIPQTDYLFSFGYGDSLELLAGSLNSTKVGYKLSCISRTTEIDKFKNEWMKKSIKIEYEPPMLQQKAKLEQQITHFYVSGDKLLLPISLYVTLKFGLVNPKILIIVDSLRQVYRYSLFLQRCRINNVGVYNHENPINLRFYILSVWMNGSTNILIATKQILADISNNVFKANVKKSYKRQHFELVNMTAIITIGLDHLANDFNHLFSSFQLKPLIMTFLENSQKEINHLQNLIAYQNQHFQHTIIKEIPITKIELQGFRYRINDVWANLNNHKSDLFQTLDFKKKLLKTPELKEEFQTNATDRENLVKTINDLRKKIDHGKVMISEFVPEYLVPECLKASYQQKMKINQAKIDEETPANYQKVKKVLRYVNLDEENPETTEVSRLKLVSARKRWKLLHGFKLKKSNKRKQKKGIFQAS